MERAASKNRECLPILIFNKMENPAQKKPTNFKCLKCEYKFNLSAQKDDYFVHLYTEHRLVIADVKDIAILEDYLEFWQNEFKGVELEEYCTTMLMDQLPDGKPAKNEKYYLLSDVLPKDLELRQKLKQKRLEKALQQHEFELTDRTFEKECLYCRDVIKGLRADFLEHLFHKHFLQLGKPGNLVYVDELLAKVQKNLGTLICLYCEKIFKDRVTLKEHMRKKGHKRINENNIAYDKFFLINYRCDITKPFQRKLHEKTEEKSIHQCAVQTNNTNCECKLNRRNNDVFSSEVEDVKAFAKLNRSSEDSDSDWSDWNGEESLVLRCLFCTHQETTFDYLKKHLNDNHGIDFDASVRVMNFYQKVKMVNFVRRQVCLLHCLSCEMHFENSEKLLQHMSAENHYSLGTKKEWDKPEYFFPTYEDDGLLCVLDNDFSNDVIETVVPILSEDTAAQMNKDAERLSLDNL